jgi:drug/metabolite transporter (DMT)-like permease
MTASAPVAKPRPDDAAGGAARALTSGGRRVLGHSAAVALMVAVTLMWSTAGVVTRHLEQARSFEVTFWRSFFTVLCLLVILPVFQGRGVSSSRMRQGGAALWISGLCWCGMFTFFMVAITLTTVANVLVTMALAPLLTAVAARVFIGHRIARRTAGGDRGGGVCGIGWMYGNQLAQGINFTGTLVALVRGDFRCRQLDGHATRPCQGA